MAENERAQLHNKLGKEKLRVMVKGARAGDRMSEN
jgi:hypothetical protein